MAVIQVTASCYPVVDNRAICYWLRERRAKVAAATGPHSIQFQTFGVANL